MNRKLFQMLPGLDHEELLYIDNITADLSEDKLQTFVTIYSGKRKSADTILICTLLGFIGVAGIQRFLLNQIGMGILFLLTYGLCLIGTIVDLVNYKKLTFDFNQKMAHEALQMTNMIRG